MATGVTESNYRTVTLAGKSTALEGVDVITVPGEVMDITGADSNVANLVNLTDYIPENVKWADRSFGGRVTATVYIEPIAVRELVIPEKKIQILNVPTGFTAKLLDGDDGYTLAVSGLEEQVSALQEESVYGTIDLAAYLEEKDISSPKAGAYVVPIEFVLPEDIRVSEEVTARAELIAHED